MFGLSFASQVVSKRSSYGVLMWQIMCHLTANDSLVGMIDPARAVRTAISVFPSTYENERSAASDLVAAIAGLARVVETTELQQRLESIERAIQPKKEAKQ